MKNSNVVSSSVLLFNGLVFLVLGARVLSAPDVFADELGFVSATQTAIDGLSAAHAGSFLALGAASLAAAYTPVLARWFALLLLSLLGVAAWFALWQLGGHYATLLSALLGVNLIALVTAFLGEPLFGASTPARGGDEDTAQMRWG